METSTVVHFVSFYSLAGNLYLKLNIQNNNGGKAFIIDFYKIFCQSVDSDDVNCQQIVNKELLIRIDEFLKRYGKTSPTVHKLKAYFKSLKENTIFIIVPDSNFVNREVINDILIHLHSIELNKSFSQVKEDFNALFSTVLENYTTVEADGNTVQLIGEKDKGKRICRFCQKSAPEVTFKSKAHAISEALGNKAIFLNEECDRCNLKFGNTIEPDIYKFLRFFLQYLGIKGKRKKRKYNGKNFTMLWSDSDKADFTINLFDAERMQEPTSIVLQTYDKIVLQNIYRALCKFAVSIVQNVHLPAFVKTISWINGEFDFKKLPKVAKTVTYKLIETYSNHPSITVYLRTNKSSDLPMAVAEFRFGFYVFVYIVPTSIKEANFYSKKENFKNFWNTFKHYKASKLEWVYHNFSSTKAVELSLRINNK